VKPIRVGFENLAAVPGFNPVFVDVKFLYTGYKQFPDSSVGNTLHFMFASVPAVKVPGYGYTFGVRCPGPEKYAFFIA
jgi:hypothetical protein